MYFRIAYDKPGRLRTQSGKWIFDAEEGRGIASAILEIDGVTRAEAREANGSIVIEYSKKTARAKIIKLIEQLDVKNLPTKADDVDLELAQLDNNFWLSLGNLVFWRYLRRFVLPYPLRLAFTVANAAWYVKEGLKVLKEGRLGVEVLDATAITTSLLTGHMSTAGQVMFLLKVSDIIADYTQARTRSALRQNLSLFAEKVWLVRGKGQDIEIPIEDVKIGDHLRVRSGSLIPIDGKVIEGMGAVNESSMTGESALVAKEKNDTVHAGTVVEEGDLVIEATALVGQSRIDAIVDMVENNQAVKSSAQSKAEALADSIVPISLGLFIADLLITRSVQRALSVLMVDYSCAIKLAMPLAVMSAMREGTQNDAVIKGGKFLENFAEADTIVFDKTGTLTNARPEVRKVVSLGSRTEDRILQVAACLEEHYPHSMARAIVRGAQARGLDHKHELHTELEYIVAHGIASKVEGKRVVLGSAHFLFDDEKVPKPKDLEEKVFAGSEGCSVVFMAIDGQLEGAILIEDPLRSDAKQVVKKLRDAGFTNIVMLTGDSENCAKRVAKELKLDGYFAQVLPEDKANYVEKMKAEGHKVVMVGDGINDSPALAAADVSVAMSDASDIARNVADITLLNASLDSLITVRELSCKLNKRIAWSYDFIVRFNTLLIILGIAGVLSPDLAATLHNASTVALSAANTRPLLEK